MRNRQTFYMEHTSLSSYHFFHSLLPLFLSILLFVLVSLHPLTFFKHIHYHIPCLHFTISLILCHAADTFHCEPLNRGGMHIVCMPEVPCSLLVFHIICLFSYCNSIKTTLRVKYVCVLNVRPSVSSLE